MFRLRPKPKLELVAPPEKRAQNADAVLRRLEWTVLRRLDGVLQGN